MRFLAGPRFLHPHEVEKPVLPAACCPWQDNLIAPPFGVRPWNMACGAAIVLASF